MAGCLLVVVLQAAPGHAAPSSTAGAPQPDPVSAACLTCHDGTKGSRASYCLLSQSGGGGHVISVAYAEAARRNPGLRPAGSLPPALVLHEGIFTCATCHGLDPHNGAPLAMTNVDSALCRACHLK